MCMQNSFHYFHMLLEFQTFYEIAYAECNFDKLIIIYVSGLVIKLSKLSTLTLFEFIPQKKSMKMAFKLKYYHILQSSKSY